MFALADDAQLEFFIFFEVGKLFAIKARQFGNAQARGKKRLKNRPIAHAGLGSSVGSQQKFLNLFQGQELYRFSFLKSLGRLILSAGIDITSLAVK